MTVIPHPRQEALPASEAVRDLPAFWHIVYTQFRTDVLERFESMAQTGRLMSNRPNN